MMEGRSKRVLPVSGKVNVFVSAPGSDAVRRASFIRLIELYPIDLAREEAFVGGDRVLLRGEVTDNEAQRIATSLRALGLRVDVEACASAAGMMDLGGFTSDEPARAPSSADTFNPLFDVSVGLVGLDGEDDHAAPDPAPAPAPLAGGLLGGMMSVSLRDEDEPLAGGDRPRPVAPQPTPAPRKPAPPPMPRAAAPPPRAPAPPPPAPPVQAPSFSPTGHDPREANLELDPASRFRPKGVKDSGEMLAIDRPPPDPMVSMRPAEDVVEVPRCPTHGVPKQGGRCPSCDAEAEALRGKLFGGRLRDKPPLRIGIGIGAGLLVGYVLTAPMARRAERAIDGIREEARRERARPLEETQAHAAQLEQQADEASQSAFMKTLAVWGIITAAVTGVWFKLT